MGVVARCAGCGGPVPVAGQTCSFKCYEHCCDLFASGHTEWIEWMLDMPDQPWYDNELDKIRQRVENFNADSPLYEKLRQINS